ncbi:MAG TPA: hypothetical protein VNM24_13410 [Burkholderiales bacterium]|jgi:hypothetical protein|nr:hypothetical protein [Burkholderiales bacterium]
MKDTPFDRIASDCMSKKMAFPEQLARQYVRILLKINEVWGSPAAVRYLDELILPSRIDRQGFSPEVIRELISLKQLHEFVYPDTSSNVWDPYYHLYRERFKDFYPQPDGGESPSRVEVRAKARPRPSVYKSWFATDGSRHFRTSPIGKLYPSKGFSERKTHPSPDPVLNAGMEEILEDAEDMLGIRRLQSAIALFEQAILRCPHYSAYPHLRLLEMYYDLDRREDFERVARKFSECFSVGPVRWVLIKSELWTQLDKIAAALLEKYSS